MKPSLLLLLALGACVSAPKRPVVPAPAPRPAPAPLPPPPPAAWEDRVRTAGSWTWSAGRADFAPGTPDAVALVCERATIGLSRAGATGPLTIRTTTLARTLRFAERVQAGDPLFDAIVFSRGKWQLATPGLPDLILPPWAEIARVVEDCRG